MFSKATLEKCIKEILYSELQKQEEVSRVQVQKGNVNRDLKEELEACLRTFRQARITEYEEKISELKADLKLFSKESLALGNSSIASLLMLKSEKKHDDKILNLVEKETCCFLKFNPGRNDQELFMFDEDSVAGDLDKPVTLNIDDASFESVAAIDEDSTQQLLGRSLPIDVPFPPVSSPGLSSSKEEKAIFEPPHIYYARTFKEENIGKPASLNRKHSLI